MGEIVHEVQEAPSGSEIEELWSSLTPGARFEAFKTLSRAEAEDFFWSLSAPDQVEILLALPAVERRGWMRLLAPDDAADVVQAAPEDERDGLLALLDDSARKEVTALLAYAEDQAGGLMSPRFARVRPDMTADEAISYLHKQARERRDASRLSTTCTSSMPSSVSWVLCRSGNFLKRPAVGKSATSCRPRLSPLQNRWIKRMWVCSLPGTRCWPSPWWMPTAR